MGSFFLYRRDTVQTIDAVQEVFHRKGFDLPNVFDLGSYKLMLYKKQLVDAENYVFSDDSFICSVGTLVYKGCEYEKSLKELKQDIENNEINFEKLIGNFCVIYFKNNSLKFLTDQQNVQHLFSDINETFITSSFLAAMEALPVKLHINRNTTIEKLLLGYTVGVETIFSEIIHQANSHKPNSKWDFILYPPKTIPCSDGRNLEKNAKNRSYTICEYLHNIDNLRKECKPEIGLSDGYDSRTLYAATLKAWNDAISVHTHQTEGVESHRVESQTVKSITEAIGSPLTIVPTKRLYDYTEKEIDEILLDDLFFFDGRCAKDMGAFSPVYTRKYKIATAKDNKLTLNGLGGEVYRRYYLELKPFFSIKQWMKVHVYPEGVDNVIEKDLFREIHKDLCKKISTELGFSWTKITTNFSARRYYSEIVMPDCDALNCNAHNQMLFYLTPFIEWAVIRDAYKSRNALRMCGELEATMMTILDERVASFKSHYGYSFDKKPPMSIIIKRAVRGIMPNILEVLRVKKIVENKTSEIDYYDSVKKKSNLLTCASSYIEQMFPEIDFSNLRRDYTMMPNSAYLAILLYTYRDKIE